MFNETHHVAGFCVGNICGAAYTNSYNETGVLAYYDWHYYEEEWARLGARAGVMGGYADWLDYSVGGFIPQVAITGALDVGELVGQDGIWLDLSISPFVSMLVIDIELP